MKKYLTKTYTLLLIALFTVSLGALPATYAEQTTAKDQALTFIENALPVDLSKYTVNLTSHSTLAGVPIAGAIEQNSTRVIDMVQYTLHSNQSTIDVICNIEKNAMVFCQVYEKEGEIINDKQHTNPRDAVASFLEGYQTYTKIDSTNLIGMLDNVDTTKNSTTTIGNTKLTVSNAVWAGEEITFFNWANTINGADYTSLQISLKKNGVIDTLLDNRAIYTIGDTSINISKEQAIDIALKNLHSYSYNMSDQYIVSDFNVTEGMITAKLATSPVNYTLRPYWDIRMPLNQTYPGNVQGITVFIWANTGEIISYSNIAFGSVDTETSNHEATLSPEVANLASLDTSLVIAIALAAIVLAAASLVIMKKRKK